MRVRVVLPSILRPRGQVAASRGGILLVEEDSRPRPSYWPQIIPATSPRSGESTSPVESSLSHLAERRKQVRSSATGAAVMSWMGPDGKPRTVAVALKDRSEMGVGLLLAEPVPAQETVWLVFEDMTSLPGVALHCAPEANRYRVGVRTVEDGRQRARDQVRQGAARLRWLDPQKLQFETVVSFRNAGAGLLEAESWEAIPSPAIVLLQAGAAQALGCTLFGRQTGKQHFTYLEVLGSILTRSPEGRFQDKLPRSLLS